jgi:hypothetical protein
VLGALPTARGRRREAPPDTTLVLRDVAVDRARLAAYDRVCGFRLTDALPATYQHVLAFPLAMQLMSAPEFPFPLPGVVHVGNRIEVRRRIDAGERLDLAVHAADLRPHERGRQLDVIAVATAGGEEVWRGVSTYLWRESGSRPGPRGERQRAPQAGPDALGEGARRGEGDRPAPPAASARWRVQPRVGTDYAAVSGDHNPIHTSRLGARLFGFPRPIAHGMWSKARCLAALEGRLPEAYTCTVSFRAPVLLPSTVAFSAAPTTGSGWAFALHSARSGRPHLTGEVTA